MKSSDLYLKDLSNSDFSQIFLKIIILHSV